MSLRVVDHSTQQQSEDCRVNIHAMNTRQVAATSHCPSMDIQQPTAAVASTSHHESMEEIQSPKKVNVPSSAKQTTSADEEEGSSCPICLDTWSSSGVHRLVSLKCGHLFGESCIRRWLKCKKGKKGKCPQCNLKASSTDIRYLFVPGKSLQVEDTTERDFALRELKREKEERRKAERTSADACRRLKMAVAECDEMKKTFPSQQPDHIRSRPRNASLSSKSPVKSSPSPVAPVLAIEKSKKISETGGCRVMAYSDNLSTLCISQPSNITLFPGYGITQMSVLDFHSMQYMPIHSKAIRDVAFDPTGLLMTCSMDKTVKMTSLRANRVVQTYQCTNPVWSCTWNLSDPWYFYAGQMNGRVFVFDIRNSGTHVEQLNTEGSHSPTVAIRYVGRSQGRPYQLGGLLVGQLDKSTFFENRGGGTYQAHDLHLAGILTSLSVAEDMLHLLVSYRPSARHPTVRHRLCKLTYGYIREDFCGCNVVHTFQGGTIQKMLGRSKFVTNPIGNRMFVCAGDEASLHTNLWDVKTGQPTYKLIGISAPVMDICSLRASASECYLSVLTDKWLNVFKWK